MNRLQEKLVEQYVSHYKRVNKTLDLPAPGSRQMLASDLMYGSFVHSVDQGGKVLDLGCGTGLLLHWLSQYPNITPIGVDGSQGQVDVARANLSHIEIHFADGLDFLQQHPDTFHGIFSTDVIEHIPDDILLDWIVAVTGALKPGGFFICRTPNAANLFGAYSRYMDLTHHRSFTRQSLIQLLEVGGMVNCRVIPIQAVHFSGRLRLWLEWLFHKLLFLLTGRGLETIFTSNVVAIGFKP